MEGKRVVIFDFDGVIVDSFEAAYKINAAKFKKLTPDDYRSWFKNNVGDILKKNLSSADINDLFNDYKKLIKEMPIVPGIIDVLKKLAEKYTLAIVSSTDSSAIQNVLKNYSLTNYFADILGYDVESSKVKKIKMIENKYGVLQNNCLFITDTLGDIKEGNEAGVKTIGVTWGYHDRGTLENGNPIALIDTPDELEICINQQFSNVTM